MSDGSRWSPCWSVSCVKLCCNGSCIVKWWFEPRQKPSICSWNRYNCDWCCFKRLHGRNNASLLKARSLSTSSRMIIPIRFFWSFLSFCSYTALQFQRNLFFKLDFFSNNFSTDLHSLGTNKKNRKQTVWQFIDNVVSHCFFHYKIQNKIFSTSLTLKESSDSPIPLIFRETTHVKLNLLKQVAACELYVKQVGIQVQKCYFFKQSDTGNYKNDSSYDKTATTRKLINLNFSRMH